MYSSGVEKGVMVPPVIIDVNGDAVDDILISMFEGKLVLKNGWDLSIVWTASFPGTETYSTPAPGYFDDDDVIDFMVHLSTGTWPRYNVSNVSTGNTLYTLNSHVSSKAEALVKAFEPSHGTSNNFGFRPGTKQTRLYSHRSRLEAFLDVRRRGIVLFV